MYDVKTDLQNVIYGSPWRNSYWFTRYLLNTDQYGALGKDEKLMQGILSETKAILTQPLSDEDKLSVCLSITENKIRTSARENTKARDLRENFIARLLEEVTSLLLSASVRSPAIATPLCRNLSGTTPHLSKIWIRAN